MVGNHPVGGQIFLAFVGCLPCQSLGFIQQRFEQIGFIVTVNTLDDRDDPFKTHTGIDMAPGQGLEGCWRSAVVLDENIVPYLDNAAAFPVYFTNMTGIIFHVACIRSKIVMDLAARSAWTGFRHFPKIIITTAFYKVV